jgi:hypothetical protein
MRPSLFSGKVAAALAVSGLTLSVSGWGGPTHLAEAAMLCTFPGQRSFDGSALITSGEIAYGATAQISNSPTALCLSTNPPKDGVSAWSLLGEPARPPSMRKPGISSRVKSQVTPSSPSGRSRMDPG